MNKILLKLSKFNYDLLIEILRKRERIELLKNIEEKVFCEPSNRETIRQILIDEFCEMGLEEKDEPNSRGILLEDLIDAIGRE